MVNIYNCGQGDCFEITPCFLPKPLFIDLGKSSFSLPIKADIDVLITHSHNDHVLGKLKNINNISRIFVPAYYPEFLRINNKLRNQISQYGGIKFELLYEGKTIKIGRAHV